MSNIAVLYMGGTFGCIGNPLHPMPASDFIQKLESLYNNKYAVDFFAAPIIKDSSDLSAIDWLQLSLYIKSLIPKYKQFIVIHGTDTLSYAASFLHHIFSDTVNIILTGSQYPLLNVAASDYLIPSDADANFTFAYQQALENHKGVYVAFNNSLHPANTCYKQDTEAFNAFLSFPATTSSIQSIATHLKIDDELIADAKNIRLINYYVYPAKPEHHVENLSQLLNASPNILILQCFGSGNLPHSTDLTELLERLVKNGCWVIVSSQVLSGSLSQKYATGSWLNNIKLVFDPHHSQADLYARAVLLYLQHGQQSDWQQYWV